MSRAGPFWDITLGLSDVGVWRLIARVGIQWHAFCMAEKRTKEDKLRRNIQRLEKAEQTLERERREPAPEHLRAIAAQAASDST